MNNIKLIYKYILNFLFPNRCIYCNKILDIELDICLCENCDDKIQIKHLEKREFKKKFFEQIKCVAVYQGFVRRAVIKFKFHGKRYYKTTFANLIYRTIEKSQDYLNADFITCVPLSKNRFESRGYNQSADICEEISSIMGKPFFNDLILKIKEVEPLAGMNRKMRAKAIRGAFILNETYDIKGKSIILIDDIYTTGATINECAKVLKLNGAKFVYAATMCTTVYKNYQQ